MIHRLFHMMNFNSFTPDTLINIAPVDQGGSLILRFGPVGAAQKTRIGLGMWAVIYS